MQRGKNRLQNVPRPDLYRDDVWLTSHLNEWMFTASHMAVLPTIITNINTKPNNVTNQTQQSAVPRSEVELEPATFRLTIQQLATCSLYTEPITIMCTTSVSNRSCRHFTGESTSRSWINITCDKCSISQLYINVNKCTLWTSKISKLHDTSQITARWLQLGIHETRATVKCKEHIQNSTVAKIPHWS